MTRILFIAPNRVGDAVTTTGVLDQLIRQHPGCRVTVACGPAAEGVFTRMPNLDRILVVAKQRRDMHWLKLWWQVAFNRWDVAVDVRGSGLLYLIPARRRAVRRRRTPGVMSVQHAAMLRFAPPPLPVAWTAAADQARAAALLPGGRKVIGLGATANWAPKVWPADRFAALFRKLAEGPLPGAVPAIFAGPGEAERQMAAPLVEALPGAIDLRGILTLPEAAACIERCALYVGNDSGLMHLAAATGTPTLGLFGITVDRVDEMAPAGRRAAWVRGGAMDMDSLTVDHVYAACAKLLG